MYVYRLSILINYGYNNLYRELKAQLASLVSLVSMETPVSTETMASLDPREHKVPTAQEDQMAPRDLREERVFPEMMDPKDLEEIPVMVVRRELEDQLEMMALMDKMVFLASKDLRVSREPRETWDRR